jgi:hypothetical protein
VLGPALPRVHDLAASAVRAVRRRPATALRPTATRSILLGAATDLVRGKPELIAENDREPRRQPPRHGRGSSARRRPPLRIGQIERSSRVGRIYRRQAGAIYDELAHVAHAGDEVGTRALNPGLGRLGLAISEMENGVGAQGLEPRTSRM